MPTYEYACKACKHTFEEFQSIKASPLKKCPECGKSALERLIGTGAALIFKGSGFYQTDYRSEAYKKSAEADTKTDSKSETKPDSKPEPKSDSKAEPKPAKADAPRSAARSAAKKSRKSTAKK